MSYAQLRDVLKSLRKGYADFETRLVREKFEDPKLASFAHTMLLAERHMRVAICGVESSLGQAKLNLWLQFFPDRTLRVLFEKDIVPLNSIDALLDFYWQFNQTLVELFELVERCSESESVRNVFQGLKRAEIQVGCDLAWAARDFQNTRPAA